MQLQLFPSILYLKALEVREVDENLKLVRCARCNYWRFIIVIFKGEEVSCCALCGYERGKQ